VEYGLSGAGLWRRSESTGERRHIQGPDVG